MRIGCLQFAPRVGEFESNKSRAEAILARADPEDLQSLDLLVLPEMALSGYNFKSREHIEPHLEPTTAGPSAQWAREKAREYGCTVAVGYPEKVEGFEREYYNSLVVVNSQGETLANYRKSFLYYTDETWAREGQGFFRGPLGNFGQVAMGICMDINPYKFEAPWDAYEFGFHVQRLRPNLVILSMAWLTNDDRTKFLSMPDKPDLSTLSYWVQRLTPVLHDKSGDETIVVFSNRCGIEDDATYAGTSTVLGIKNGEVVIYGILGRNVEELLVVDTRDLPMGELVTRSTTSVEDEDSEAEETNHRPGAEPRRPSANSEGSGRGVDSPTLPPSNSRSSAGGHTHATAQQANMNINGQRNLETPSPRSNALSARPKLSARKHELMVFPSTGLTAALVKGRKPFIGFRAPPYRRGRRHSDCFESECT
ncbi:putative N-terminal asparagine protein [Thermochaetoides thermophila DSM 1495]|uniref:Putative N-terminal asparagine protein n=1 Tax=Chaetomium thermophilum (strain DSM 1495 / CBS 144.50 / IMI 039719) TaxID=759272 RepID=G0SGJ7_CHATD|nr:putative N-terminal asparagine protein [Thermochaetoides thermophila DSM 1495]EGS17336.1 putative N-terminal asparagine protein [Thermochaetoides thermophila DSM 1495]